MACCRDEHCSRPPPLGQPKLAADAVGGRGDQRRVLPGRDHRGRSHATCRLAGRCRGFLRRGRELRDQPGRSRDGARLACTSGDPQGQVHDHFRVPGAWQYGSAALAADGGVAMMLRRRREGDANRRSVRVCSRDDAIGNLTVLVAAAGVFATGTGWPDVIVDGLGLQSGVSILRLARAGLQGRAVAPASPGRLIPSARLYKQRLATATTAFAELG